MVTQMLDSFLSIYKYKCGCEGPSLSLLYNIAYNLSFSTHTILCITKYGSTYGSTYCSYTFGKFKFHFFQGQYAILWYMCIHTLEREGLGIKLQAFDQLDPPTADVYHRILRFQNYLVAMINKNILPCKIHVPFYGEK